MRTKGTKKYVGRGGKNCRRMEMSLETLSALRRKREGSTKPRTLEDIPWKGRGERGEGGARKIRLIGSKLGHGDRLPKQNILFRPSPPK